MQAGGAACSGPFIRCREEGGLPVRFVGESDVCSFAATDEFSFAADRAGVQHNDVLSNFQSWMSGKDVHRGTRARLTTHRLIWHTGAEGWLALRLDTVLSTKPMGGLRMHPGCEVQLLSGGVVTIQCNDNARADELLRQLQGVVAACKWSEGSYNEAATGGLQRILGQRDARQQAVNETLDVALTDLKSLKQHATQTVAAVRQVTVHTAAEESGEGSGVQRLLDDFGLTNPDGTLVAKGGHSRVDVDADVARVCKAVLERRGGLGMLLAHDVFCLVNRARGTAPVSPAEVMSALYRCAAPGGQLQLRVLGSTGAFAVSLAKSSNADADAHLLRLAKASPLSAFRLAAALGLTAAEAKYVLRDAEARATLVRDDAPEGVFYYPNFFADF